MKDRQQPALLVIAAAISTATTVLATPAAAESKTIATEKVKVAVTTIADGLDHPWAVEVLPNGDYIVTERPGRMRIVHDGKLSPPLKGLPQISSGGQGGLLDVALDPHFSANRTLYFTASVDKGQGKALALFKGKLSAAGDALDGVKQIFVTDRPIPGSMQFGSRIAFAADGSLFFSSGDRADPDRAQDPTDDAGSILHLEADGSIPADNPFKDGKKARPEIWSIGHRNPEGITFDSKTGTLYTAEHGARGGDEINNPQPGKNYGWPVISYGKNYDGSKIGVGTQKTGMEQPLFYWDPSIAPGAIAVYRGTMFPEWDGDLLVTALKFQLVSHLTIGSNGNIEEKERMFKGDFGRLRDIVVDPQGALLLTTDKSNGELLRVTRADAK